MIENDTSYGKPITKCRISGSTNLLKVLSLGDMALTGRFPKKGETVPHGPLELWLAPDSGLVQLGHSYPDEDLFSDSYGYRSSLNGAMLDHLMDTAHRLERLVDLQPHDVVLDIGSNDCTLLKGYHTPRLERIGIDPLCDKFDEYYPDEIARASFLFSASTYRDLTKRKAKIVTSMAMFYDLEDPVAFARDVASILAPDGVWYLEQSYLPSMLRNGAYDTICHEHLEYYSLTAIEEILKQAGLSVIDVSFNNVNGGSFAVTAAHGPALRRANTSLIEWVLDEEEQMNIAGLKPYITFGHRVQDQRESLRALLHSLKQAGKKVIGLGASTKFNVVCQYCGLDEELLSCISDVNPEKWGKVTPGTGIPIVSEEYAKELKPDYMLVGPWHFRAGLVEREHEFLQRGGRLIFPLPYVEII